MKTLVVFFGVIALASAVHAQPSIAFDREGFDFDTVRQGEIVKHVFEFENTGTEPLQILRVKPSCGCTTPEYTREPVLPGERGKLLVTFNSAGKLGPQNKTVAVYTNVAEGPEGTFVLRFTGYVVAPKIRSAQ